uniref:Melanotransferrin n=1 Tax=Phallusia mammillata TaxID=59560 RepID=A0A6F9DLC4_9ASCI|nr:melanotransferrin [Phallusia mammillata]
MSKIRYKRTKNEHEDEKPLPMNEVTDEVMEMKDMNEPSTSTDIEMSEVSTPSPQVIYKSQRRTSCYLGWAVLSTILLLSVITIAILAHPKPRYLKWCCVGEYEKAKCVNMSKHFGLNGLRPKMECIVSASPEACVKLIDQDKADAFTIDIPLLHKNRDILFPMMAEEYKVANRDELSVYSVAVAKKSDIGANMSVTSFQDRRACIGSWPLVGGLLANMSGRVYHSKQCNSIRDATKQFKASCSVDKSNPSVCHGCRDVISKAACEFEQYKGFEGAIRCMLDSTFNAIAFTTNEAVFNLIENNASVFGNITKDDLVLLCSDGTRASLDNYDTCNLGLMPTRAVVVSSKIRSGSDVDIPFELIELLHVAQLYFGSHSTRSFNMFRSHDHTDLLFKDSTQKLAPMNIFNCTTKTYLGSSYMQLQQSLSCSNITTVPEQTCYLPQYSSNL